MLFVCINRQIAKVHHIAKGGFALKGRSSCSSLVHRGVSSSRPAVKEAWPSEAEDNSYRSVDKLSDPGILTRYFKMGIQIETLIEKEENT